MSPLLVKYSRDAEISDNTEASDVCTKYYIFIFYVQGIHLVPWSWSLWAVRIFVLSNKCIQHQENNTCTCAAPPSMCVHIVTKVTSFSAFFLSSLHWTVFIHQNKILCKRTSLLYSAWVWHDYSCLTMALAMTQHTWHGNVEEASKAHSGYVIYNRITRTIRQCDMVRSMVLLIRLTIHEWVPSAQHLIITKKLKIQSRLKSWAYSCDI